MSFIHNSQNAVINTVYVGVMINIYFIITQQLLDTQLIFIAYNYLFSTYQFLNKSYLQILTTHNSWVYNYAKLLIQNGLYVFHKRISFFMCLHL